MQQRYHVSMSIEFNYNLMELPKAVFKRALRVSWKMVNNPWAKELHPEPIQGAEQGIHSARVDDNYRIIWKHIKPTEIILCFIGKHDDAYRRACRTSFTLNQGVIEICDTVEIEQDPNQMAQNITRRATIERAI